MSLEAKIQRVVDAEKAIAAHNKLGDPLQQELAEAELDLVDAFEGSGVEKIVAHGQSWQLEVKTTVSPAAGMQQDVVDYIVSHGGEDLVKPSMHAGTRNAWLREQFLDDDGNPVIPEDAKHIVSTFDVRKVARRKA